MNTVRGKRFVLTGKMWTDRASIEDAIQKLGGQIETRVKWAHYLVQASGQWGRKTQKQQDAKTWGVDIIDDKKLYEMLVESNNYEAERLRSLNGGH